MSKFLFDKLQSLLCSYYLTILMLSLLKVYDLV